MTAGAARRAVVFGGGSGIGAAVSIELGRRGYEVIVAGRDVGRLDAVRTKLLELGAAAEAVRADVTNDEDVRALFAHVAATASGMDLLVNSAGVGELGSLRDTTPDRFQDIVTTNLVGPYRTAFHARPLLEAAQGQIINVLSRVGRRPYGGIAAYGTSKAALVYLTRALSIELADAGVRVNGVSPGATATPLRQKLFGDEDPGKLLSPDDVARVVAWLADAPSPRLTGTVVDVPW